MSLKGRLFKLALCLLALLMALPAFTGCGGGRPAQVSYVVRQDRIAIGKQSVRYEKKAGETTYSASERRPYAVYDTTTYRAVAVTADLRSLKSYYSNRRVPGASYRTYINRAGSDYYYLDDKLQVFGYEPRLSAQRSFLPFEPDSACLMQALADKFFASRLKEAAALVIIPSRGSALREVLVKRESKGTLSVTGEGIPQLSLEFDGSGVLSQASGGGMVISRGGSGAMGSRPFQPTGKAREITDVKIATPDKLPGGDKLELAGSLYIPSGKRPYAAVVLAGDFGPQDRTGGGFLAQLARKLVDDGMAVLACDKRGVPQSQGGYGTYTFDTAVSDLNSQIDYLVLRGDVDIQRISLVGFGEGGAVACKVAAANPYVSSLALMATPSVPLFPQLSLVQVQGELNVGLVSRAEAVSAALQIQNLAGLVASTGATTIKLEGHGLFLGWMRSQAANGALTSVGALKVPVLVMQGGRDASVPPDQAKQIMATLQGRGTGTQELALFENLGHDFGPMLLEAQTVPYRDHPIVDPAVLKKLSGWLGANLKVKK